MGQKDLMRKLGIRSQPQMSQIENGSYRVGENTLERIASIFNVPISYLYSKNLSRLILQTNSTEENSSFQNQMSQTGKLSEEQPQPEKTNFILNSLSTGEKKFIFLYYPYLYPLLKSYTAQYVSVVQGIPPMRKILFKLRLLNSPLIKITNSETNLLASKSNTTPKSISEKISAMRRTCEQINTLPILKKLIFDLEATLYAISFAKRIKSEDKVKLKYFIAKKRHYLKRIKTIIKLNLPDIQWLSETSGLNLQKTKYLLKSATRRIARSFEKTIT